MIQSIIWQYLLAREWAPFSAHIAELLVTLEVECCCPIRHYST